MFGSRTKAWAMFTPNGRSVRSCIFLISSRTASSSPDDVSMMPRPPAFDTAEASWLRAIQPMGAWTIGTSTPRSSVTRLLMACMAPTVVAAPRQRSGTDVEAGLELLEQRLCIVPAIGMSLEVEGVALRLCSPRFGHEPDVNGVKRGTLVDVGELPRCRVGAGRESG